MDNTINEVIKENKLLKEENEKLKKSLENYNNSRNNYYEKNKEIVNEKAKERLKKIAHEILTPKEETKCRIFVNRDTNACKNILLLGKCYLESQTRPEEFTRKVIKTEKVKNPKKQVIKNK